MIDPTSLAEKTALVIGGAGGIGAATAQILAEAGARVAITHRPGKEKESAAKAILGNLPGKDHAAFPADVADTSSLIALRASVERAFSRLNILVNTSGFTKPVPHGDLDALDDEFIDRMFAVNWRGQFAAIRTFAPLLKASGDGLIVSVSSVAGSSGNGSNIAYGAAKAGIDVMTKSLARVLAPQVRVVGVAPGAVDTSFVPGRGAEFNAKAAAATPLKRIASANDIAATILACATHLTFVTGTTIRVDGGRSL
ncbi:MAG: SDR family oxidoreductase [Hyphomicrobiales bacterium]|nr:SDR family oxidoreductase [Hyphomicrobiales bacterium]MBV9516835.1 SDR family oxidoreductase [Hyphomicrobiales bacterium]